MKIYFCEIHTMVKKSFCKPKKIIIKTYEFKCKKNNTLALLVLDYLG